MRSYVDSDYRPSTWLAFLLTSMPAGNQALPTMLPRMASDNVVLTQVKQVRKAAKAIGKQGQPKEVGSIVQPVPAREIVMIHKIATEVVGKQDPLAHLKRKMEAFKTQIAFLEAEGMVQEVRKYKRLQLETSTAICDALVKLDDEPNIVIDLLNSSTSSSSSSLHKPSSSSSSLHKQSSSSSSSRNPSLAHFGDDID